MKRHYLLIHLLLMSLTLQGCWLGYQPDIYQGNEITPYQVAQLKTEMSHKEVQALLGTSLVSEIKMFDDGAIMDQDNENTSIMEYIYFYQPASGTAIKKKLHLAFVDDKLIRFEVTP
jgi:hypothetical protein